MGAFGFGWLDREKYTLCKEISRILRKIRSKLMIFLKATRDASFGFTNPRYSMIDALGKKMADGCIGEKEVGSIASRH